MSVVFVIFLVRVIMQRCGSSTELPTFRHGSDGNWFCQLWSGASWERHVVNVFVKDVGFAVLEIGPKLFLKTLIRHLMQSRVKHETASWI